jgi:hypothetical protein
MIFEEIFSVIEMRNRIKLRFRSTVEPRLTESQSPEL